MALIKLQATFLDAISSKALGIQRGSLVSPHFPSVQCQFWVQTGRRGWWPVPLRGVGAQLSWARAEGAVRS